eukprot:symbB.v1.2.029910.t1/scaffold3322.1/size91521/8
MFQLPWTCSSPSSSVHEPVPQEELPKQRCKKSKKRENTRRAEKTPNETRAKPTRGGWLSQDMTAREQAQTFVAMSGFPMPFLP